VPGGRVTGKPVGAMRWVALTFSTPSLLGRRLGTLARVSCPLRSCRCPCYVLYWRLSSGSLGPPIKGVERKAVSILFDPGTIGKLSLRNRLLRSATAEYMADAEGRPEIPLADLYGALARGGVGLIITGHCYVHGGGRCQVRMTGVHRDELISSLEVLAATVHREGGLVVMQINHGGRECREDAIPGKPVAPSPVPTAKGKEPPEELDEEGIREIVAAFGDAAGRAKAAGFDGVQIHAAHGYLINQFNSPAANWRRDRWGGTPARRMRFLEEVAAAVRDRVGNDYPVLIKLGMQDSVCDGLTLKDGAEIASHLADWGIDGLEVSSGLGGTSSRKDILRVEDEGYFLDAARAAREATDLAIALVGGLRSKQVMERILEEGTADFVSMSRPLIREPDLPRRFLEGQDRSTCISCNRCWPPPGEYGITCRDPHRADEAATRGSPA
jgi:2,4-dienoyl-CoA reductase-like NADH-dependent reductase (Old Yellow Enzyme family)